MPEGSQHEHDRLFIGGDWIEPSTGQRFEVENPTTEQIIGHVPAAQAEDVDRAVTAARDAWPAWAALSRGERADHLERLRAELERRRDEMAQTITAEMGSPATIAATIQVGLPLTVIGSFVDLLRADEVPERVGNSIILAEPVGVVGAITPWNYPLHQAVAKVAAATISANR